MIRRRSLGLSLTALLVSLGGLVVVSPAAQACGHFGESACGGSGGSGGTTTSQSSSGTRTATYSSPPSASSEGQTCSVYGNGTGMGSYCVSLGGGDALKTLRERFGGQKFQACRYSDLPPGVEPPFNENPGQGEYMLRECIANVDFDTYSGGRKKALDISVVFVPDGTDTHIVDNDITKFLWSRLQQDAQLPVPFMVPQPSRTPIVGVPTYFTFRWLDPATKKVVSEGPYADKEDGGPYRQINNNGLVMRAQATKIEIDPKQKDMKQISCAPGTPYVAGAPPADQPKDACSLTFKRSSASARAYSTESIPKMIQDSYYPTLRVYWNITYGADVNHLESLGPFTMNLRQSVPVQEVQVPNQPPTVVYN